MRLVDLDKVRELFRVAETCDKCQFSNIDCERVSYYTPRDICGLLDEAEEVDMDVVRCKDCKWRTGAAFWTPCQHMPTTDDWYCGFGERRDAKG